MRPIIVLAMGRSGSSLVTGSLALHGLWTGVCRPADDHNPRGYFENLRLNGALGRLYPGSIYHEMQPMRLPRRWPTFVRSVQDREGYRGGPWIVKANAFTWPVWVPFDPVFVFVRRNIEVTARSAERHDPGAELDLDDWLTIAEAHHAEMNRVRAIVGGFDVSSTRLAGGDFDQIAPVLSAIGMTVDREALASFVDPTLLSR